jgi:hypothetical protein
MLNLVCMASTQSLLIPTTCYTLQPEDLPSLLSIKLAVRYAQLREVESMRAVARAHQNRNLAEFERALRDYREGMYYGHMCYDQLTIYHPRRAFLRPDDPLTSCCAV